MLNPIGLLFNLAIVVALCATAVGAGREAGRGRLFRPMGLLVLVGWLVLCVVLVVASPGNEALMACVVIVSAVAGLVGANMVPRAVRD